MLQTLIFDVAYVEFLYYRRYFWMLYGPSDGDVSIGRPGTSGAHLIICQRGQYGCEASMDV